MSPLSVRPKRSRATPPRRDGQVSPAGGGPPIAPAALQTPHARGLRFANRQTVFKEERDQIVKAEFPRHAGENATGRGVQE